MQPRLDFEFVCTLGFLMARYFLKYYHIKFSLHFPFSILCHLERLVVLADGLPVDKVAIEDSGRRGVAGKQMQLLWKMYGRLLELMQEHAQMEERVIFPAIDSTEEGSLRKYYNPILVFLVILVLLYFAVSK